ncbi:AI-2E family transporter [Lichenihabitans psoromatis]|uniref:AI-2E family transporter n=1 Tax=Lichenihabitans psoromatis TaxID=2528642 RepID=UPI001035FD20|nr:AI-2E family transporter [Lichenihabitans psoromatis]
MAQVNATLPSSERNSTRTLATCAAVIAALYFGSEILVPIALAILLGFVLAPSVRKLQKLGLGRIPPVVVTVMIAVVFLGALGALITTQLRDLANDVPRYERTIVRKIQYLQGMSTGGSMQRIEDAIATISKAVNRQPEAQVVNGSGSSAAAIQQTTGERPAAAPMPVEVIAPTPSAIDTILRVSAPLVHPIATAGIVLIFVVFILLQREDLRNRAIRLFGATDLQRTTAAIDDGAKRLSRYLLTQCAVNTASGIIVGISLWLIGVPSPILLGIIFACMRFIPYVGPVIGSILPLVLASAVDPGWSMVIWTGAMLLAVESVIGQVVEPFAYGHNTGLSPIAIIIAATFWTVLWGPVGLFLSTPLTVCLVVLGRHVEQLEFLDVLLGDRPPLAPSETFYQRLLANDPIEASDQAQKCLSEMSVSEYYDAVALPGLLLAQGDVAQNRLDHDRQEQIKAAALDVVEDLERDAPGDDQPDDRQKFWSTGKPTEATDADVATKPDDLVPETPPQFTKAGSVLCVGARGPLDDAAAAMLVQVFLGHQIGARCESYTALSKTEIDHLNVEGVALICLSALDGSSPAFLRFVLRRLRRRAPKAHILVGAWWRIGGLRDTDEEIDQVVKDPKVTTFVDAIRYCLSQPPEGVVVAVDPIETAATLPAVVPALS